jgi:hypothetical protein
MLRDNISDTDDYVSKSFAVQNSTPSAYELRISDRGINNSSMGDNFTYRINSGINDFCLIIPRKQSESISGYFDSLLAELPRSIEQRDYQMGVLEIDAFWSALKAGSTKIGTGRLI